MARSRNALRASGAAASLLGLTTGVAAALECPVAHPTTTATALKETAQDIRENSDLLAAQGGGAVGEIITRLKSRYPKASDAEITNYLVTLYCPVVNQNAATSEAQKSARLEEFSSRVMQELTRP
jgi:hypothetical protein